MPENETPDAEPKNPEEIEDLTPEKDVLGGRRRQDSINPLTDAQKKEDA